MWTRLGLQSRIYRLLHTGLGKDVHRSAVPNYLLRMLRIEIVIEQNHLAGIDARHPVIGDNNNVDPLEEPTGFQPVDQPAERFVHLSHRLPDSVGIGAGFVAGVIDIAEVSQDQRRSLLAGEIEPRERRVNPLGVRNLLVIRPPVAWTLAAYLGLSSGEEESCCALPLLLGSHPDRLTQPPAPVLYLFALAQAEGLFELWVIDIVADDPVVIRVEAGGDGIMVREGQRRVDGSHPPSAHALPGQHAQSRGRIPVKRLDETRR